MPPDAAPDKPADDARPPDWIGEAWRVFVADVLAFLGTSAALVRHPRRFSSQWATGQTRALNPLAFMATSAALLGAAQALMVSDGGDSLFAAALALVAPYAHFAWLGLIAHATLRLLGSRQRLRASLGVALYVGGAPALVFTLLTYVLTFIMLTTTHTHGFEDAFAQLSHWRRVLVSILWFRVGFTVVLLYLGAALVGAHGVRVWKGALAIVAAILVSGTIYGFWRPPPTVGAHLVVWLRSQPFLRAPAVTVRF